MANLQYKNSGGVTQTAITGYTSSSSVMAKGVEGQPTLNYKDSGGTTYYTESYIPASQSVNAGRIGYIHYKDSGGTSHTCCTSSRIISAPGTSLLGASGSSYGPTGGIGPIYNQAYSGQGTNNIYIAYSVTVGNSGYAHTLTIALNGSNVINITPGSSTGALSGYFYATANNSTTTMTVQVTANMGTSNSCSWQIYSAQ